MKHIKNPPPRGNFSKKFQADWERYYDHAYELYKDKNKAAQVAWAIAKNKYEKSSKTGKWILRKSKTRKNKK